MALSVTGSWRDRRQRAASLLARRTHAKELLRFYGELLSLQEALYDRALGLASAWLPVVLASPGDGFPTLRLERLPLGELVPWFQQFLGDVVHLATAEMAASAKAVQSAGATVQLRLLEESLRAKDLEEVATSLGCEGRQLEFCLRAFWQPIVEALAERNPREVSDYCLNSCPQCGSPPQVAVLRDQPAVRGERLLVCSLCSCSWTFPRSTCPGCGETDPQKLIYHESPSTPHIRVEECSTCQRYLKSVDLRRDGAAVPAVEDVASVELDLWSVERGLRKLGRSVLGL